jgi:hypothetical protein
VTTTAVVGRKRGKIPMFVEDTGLIADAAALLETMATATDRPHQEDPG